MKGRVRQSACRAYSCWDGWKLGFHLLFSRCILDQDLCQDVFLAYDVYLNAGIYKKFTPQTDTFKNHPNGQSSSGHNSLTSITRITPVSFTLWARVSIYIWPHLLMKNSQKRSSCRKLSVSLKAWPSHILIYN